MASFNDAITTTIVEVFRVLFNAILGYYVMSALKKSLAYWRVSVGLTSKVAEEEEFRPTAKVSTLQVRPLRGAVTNILFMKLPTDIASSVGTYFDARDVARLSGSCNYLHEMFWNSPQVWDGLSAVRGFSPPANRLAREHFGYILVPAREHFRMNFFRIFGDAPRMLLAAAHDGCKPAAEVLEEATHMLRGILPHDNMSIVNCILEAGEAALWSRAADETRATQATESFLELLRQSDVVMPWQTAHLEEVRRTNESLDESMEMAMQKVLAEMPGSEMADFLNGVQLDSYAA